MPRPAAAARSAKAQQPLEYNLLLTVTLCLLAAGMVMVYSASSARTVLSSQGDSSAYLVRYAMSAAVGLVALFALSRHGLHLIPRITRPLLLIAFGLLVLVRMPGVGVSVNGGQRWLAAGPVQIQPSELMKLALILHSSMMLAERPKCVRRPKELIPIIAVPLLACALIAVQPDLGTALVIAFTLISLLVAAGVALRTIGGGLLIGVVVVVLFALAEPYRRARLTSFLDPWSSGDAGYQVRQGLMALGSGGLFGKGLGQSVQKTGFLPEAHTDYILAVIGEELGAVGVMGVLTLYGLMAYAGLRVAKRAVGRYAKLVAVGITSMIVCQAALNVFAVLGLAPLTGVPLPFISYGSSNLVVLLAGMGVMLNIASTRGKQLRLVTGSRGHESADRSRRDSRARRAGPGGRRHAAG
jgi:cell division protein FtsW